MTAQRINTTVPAGTKPDAQDILWSDFDLIADRSAALPVDMARSIVIAALRYAAAGMSYRAEDGCTAGPYSTALAELIKVSNDALLWLRAVKHPNAGCPHG